MTSTHDNVQMSNDNRLADALKLAAKLGGESVKSALAKPQLYITVCRGAADKFMSDKDVEAMFDGYLAGRTKVVNGNRIALGDKEDNENSRKANLSKLMSMHKLGALPNVDGPALLDRVTDRREYLHLGAQRVKGTADAFVDIARAQLAQPSLDLTDEQIDAIVARPEKGEKDMITKLCDEHKRLYKLAADMGDAMMDCTYIEQARDSVADAIRALDGEVPVYGKAGKKEKEVIEFLMSKGYSKKDATDLARS